MSDRVNREEPPENWNYNDEELNEDLRMQTLQEVDFLRCIYDVDAAEVVQAYDDRNIEKGSGDDSQRDLIVGYEQQGECEDTEKRRVTNITAVISRKMSTTVILSSSADRRASLNAEEAILKEEYEQRNCSKEKQQLSTRKGCINEAVKMVRNNSNTCTMRPLGIPRSAKIVYHTKKLLSSDTSTDVGSNDTGCHQRLCDPSYSQEIPIGYIMDVPFLVKVRITIPLQYPISAITEFLIDDPGSHLTEEDNRELVNTMRLTSASLKGTGIGTIQSIIENVKRRLVEMKEEEAKSQIEFARQRVDNGLDGVDSDGGDGDDNNVMEATVADLFQEHHQLNPNNNKLGRRCIFFHHIRNPAKRSCIQSLAKKLLLQGFCKIGYPGILIVEGSEDSCKIYVQMLQRMRWRMMVVRGEESFLIPKESNGIDMYRKVPVIMGGVVQDVQSGYAKGSQGEQSKWRKDHTTDKDVAQSSVASAVTVGCIWETNDASQIAEWCKICDLESLFKTSMKIYS